MSTAVYTPAPYERRVGEGARPYAAFCVFRDQPPGTRSVAAVEDHVNLYRVDH